MRWIDRRGNMETLEKEIVILTFIAIVIIGTVFFGFIDTFIDLYNFKQCYDINFQKTSCQKYLNY